MNKSTKGERYTTGRFYSGESSWTSATALAFAIIRTEVPIMSATGKTAAEADAESVSVRARKTRSGIPKPTSPPR